MIENLRKYIKGDMIIWGVVIGLSLFSLLAVYSAADTVFYSPGKAQNISVMVKHFSILMVGLIFLFVAHRVPVNYYKKLSVFMMIVSVPLLLITLLLGVSVNQASRWLEIPGLGLSLQTSDLAKVAVMMFLARGLSLYQHQLKDFKKGFLPLILPVLVVCALILPANFSTAALLFMSALILMFIGQVKISHLLLLAGSCIVVMVLFVGAGLLLKKVNLGDNPITQRVDTWINRLDHFSNGESDIRGADFQAEQAKIAIASGGIVGRGPGNSNQRVILPKSYNDFIYAIIIEEYGFTGGAVLLMLYLILLFRAGVIVQRCDRVFPAMLAMGLTLMLVLQSLVNMAVVVGLLPVTGQTLPLVSMGGSSLIFSTFALGVVLSVSRENKINQGKEVPPAVSQTPEEDIPSDNE